MADIHYLNIPEKTTPSVDGDFVIITDSQDGGKVKRQSATKFRGPKGDKGEKGEPGRDGTGIGDMLKSEYDADGDGKVDVAKNAESVEWENISNKPTTFPATAHTHTISNVTGLQSALDNKVSIVSGKGLSTNDYTTAEKNKLAGLNSDNFAKKSHIDFDKTTAGPIDGKAQIIQGDRAEGSIVLQLGKENSKISVIDNSWSREILAIDNSGYVNINGHFLLNNANITNEWTSWTPILAGDSGSGATIAWVDATWTRYKIIGKTIQIQCFFEITNKGNCAGNIYIQTPWNLKGSLGNVYSSINSGSPALPHYAQAMGTVIQIKKTWWSSLQWSDISVGHNIALWMTAEII